MSTTTFPRVPYTRLAADAFKGLLATSKAVHDSSIAHELQELVFLRVSQINGCGYCMDMHATSLRKAGIERLDMIKWGVLEPDGRLSFVRYDGEDTGAEEPLVS